MCSAAEGISQEQVASVNLQLKPDTEEPEFPRLTGTVTLKDGTVSRVGYEDDEGTEFEGVSVFAEELPSEIPSAVRYWTGLDLTEDQIRAVVDNRELVSA